MIDFHPDILLDSFPLLWEGVLVTLKIALGSFVLAIFVGTLVGIARSFSPLISRVLAVYVEVFRGTPLLTQLFFIYYGLPSIGVTMDNMTAAYMGLGLNGGVYISEIVRGSPNAVDRGQQDAAYALGMSWSQAMVHIILPQTMTVAIPPLVNSFSSLLKDTSLVSVLAITELTRVGQLIYTRTFRAFEIYFAIGILYFLMTYAAARCSRYLDKRYRIEGRMA